MDNRPIGVFDSGIGGVTILSCLLLKMPRENYIYYSDSKHNPYGEKTKQEVIDFVDKIIHNVLQIRLCSLEIHTLSAK